MDKYFTPDIEDIRVGYECEILWNQDIFPEDNWYSVVVGDNQTEDFDTIDYIGRIANEKIRVPFLTKEQIEVEGWEGETIIKDSWNDEKDEYIDGFSKSENEDKWWDMYITEDYTLRIYRRFYRNEVAWVSIPVFEGTCKDINTFRYILKLLGI